MNTFDLKRAMEFLKAFAKFNSDNGSGYPYVYGNIFSGVGYNFVTDGSSLSAIVNNDWQVGFCGPLYLHNVAKAVVEYAANIDKLWYKTVSKKYLLDWLAKISSTCPICSKFECCHVGANTADFLGIKIQPRLLKRHINITNPFIETDDFLRVHICDSTFLYENTVCIKSEVNNDWFMVLMPVLNDVASHLPAYPGNLITKRREYTCMLCNKEGTHEECEKSIFAATHGDAQEKTAKGLIVEAKHRSDWDPDDAQELYSTF